LTLLVSSSPGSSNELLHRLKSWGNLFGKRMSQLKCMLECVTGILSLKKLLSR